MVTRRIKAGASHIFYYYQILVSLKLKNKKYLAFVGYAVFITAVFFIMPPSPDEVTAPIDLVNGFRTMSVVAVTTFWVAEAIILGLLWQKYKTKLQES